MMKLFQFILVALLVFPMGAAGQKVFKVRYESQADIKVFVVEYESQAGWQKQEKQYLLL